MELASTVPSWHALLAELSAAPSVPVATPRRSSLSWLWVLWLILTGLMFVPMILSSSGQKLSAEITGAFPWIMLPILLFSGVVVTMMQDRALRAHNADLALFGLVFVGPSSLLARVTGQYQLTGHRRGHRVSVLLERPTRRIGPSVVSVGAPSPAFELVGQGVQLFANPGSPTPLLAVLAAACPSGPWEGVTVTAGPEGILVRRPAAWTPLPDVERERRWLYDLWLAERLASALAARR